MVSFHAQIWCSLEWVHSFLHSPLNSPCMPDIVSKGFPPLTLLCAYVCVCVFFFHALGAAEGVSHDSSFLGVVTTIIVARLSPRTLLLFWVCDISWCPPPPLTFIHTHAHTQMPTNAPAHTCTVLERGLDRVCCSSVSLCVYLREILKCVFLYHVGLCDKSSFRMPDKASLEPGFCFSSSWK